MAKRKSKTVDPVVDPEPKDHAQEQPEATAAILKRVERHTGPLSGHYKALATAIVREMTDPTPDEEDGK